MNLEEIQKEIERSQAQRKIIEQMATDLRSDSDELWKMNSEMLERECGLMDEADRLKKENGSKEESIIQTRLMAELTKQGFTDDENALYKPQHR